MKKLEIIIYMGLQDQFEEVLKEESIDEYIMIPRVLGRLKGREPNMDSHLWPGYFLFYCFCMEDDRYENFRERLLEVKKDWGEEGFLATVGEIEERYRGIG